MSFTDLIGEYRYLIFSGFPLEFIPHLMRGGDDKKRLCGEFLKVLESNGMIIMLSFCLPHRILSGKKLITWFRGKKFIGTNCHTSHTTGYFCRKSLRFQIL